jgi:hypothetical protein
MAKIYLDCASIHRDCIQALGLNDDRLTIYFNSSTMGAWIQGAYVDESCIDGQEVTLADEVIKHNYHGIAVEIHRYIPKDATRQLTPTDQMNNKF